MSCSNEPDVKNEEPEPDSVRVKVCRGCLATDCRLYDVSENQVEAYANLTGVTISSGMLCAVCRRLLYKYSDFRMRCLNADFVFKYLHPLTEEVIRTIDKTNVKLNLITSETLFINCDPTLDPFNEDPLVKTEYVHVPTTDVPLKAEFTTDEEKNPLESCSDDFNTFDGTGLVKNDIVVTNNEVRPIYIDSSNLIDNLNTFMATRMVCDDDDDIVTKDVGVSTTDIDDLNTIKDSKKDSTDEDSDPSNMSRSNDDPLTKEQTTQLEDNEKNVRVSDKRVYQITTIYRRMCLKLSNNESDLYNLLERLFKASVNEKEKKTADGLKKYVKRSKREEEHNISSFLDLYKQVADDHKVDIEFLSLEDAKRDMEERRTNITDKYCKLCCKKYVKDETCNRHLKMSHNESLPFRCQVCLFTFRTHWQFAVHLLKHAVKKTCQLCGMVIGVGGRKKRGHWSGVRSHMDMYHPASASVTHCEYCGREFRNSKVYLMHARDMHRGQINAVQCLLCGDSYNGPKGLNDHVAKIHAEAVKCVSCAVYFIDRDAFTAHTESGQCRLELCGCPLCGATFPTEQLMREHYDSTHAKHKCDKCGQTFVELKSYRFHHDRMCNRDRDKRLPQERNNALRANRKRSRTKQDKPVNNTETQNKKKKLKSLICDVCGKGFAYQVTLSCHQRAHTGERPFACALCGKAFSQKGSLRSHMAIHTGERRYKCSLCPKTFRQTGHLKSHMPSHTHERNYSCTLCPKRFTQHSTLWHHVRVVHKGAPRRNRKKPQAEGN